MWLALGILCSFMSELDEKLEKKFKVKNYVKRRRNNRKPLFNE